MGSLSAKLALASLAAVVAAQDICYPQLTSATITECVPNTGAPKPTPCGAACPNPLVSHGGRKGGPVTVAVPMPSCQECGCATCVHANVYTTSFATFCPEGITTQVYVVKELYTGMSAPPSVTQRPKVPMGFAQGVHTCHSCGPKPITTQLIYPAKGCPFVQGQSGPAPAPGGIPGWVVSPEKGGPGFTPAQDGKGWLPAPPKPEGGAYWGGQSLPESWGGAQGWSNAGPGGIPAPGIGAGPGPGSPPGPGGVPGAIPAPGSGPGPVPAPGGPQAGPGAAPGQGSNGAQGGVAPAGVAPAGVGGGAYVAPSAPEKGPGSGPDKPSGPPTSSPDKPPQPPVPGAGGPGYQQVSAAFVPTIFSALGVMFGLFSTTVLLL
ncbi:hypothetical protein KVR01_010813 [Diaporthe batatas]|uniref:uncharacterized protein n=1 Tax=Diaporthe batatas TaxID=748121 RepID=UPI001D04B088|nr:uncharacterized protein KVR01_010813 [Diaporthe batatas]KAG8159152.1 hypothetical protein KVR01_010813 [Diaporthe batatas]